MAISTILVKTLLEFFAVLLQQKAFVALDSSYDGDLHSADLHHAVLVLPLLLMFFLSAQSLRFADGLWWKFLKQTILCENVHMQAWILMDPDWQDMEWRTQCRMVYVTFLVLVEHLRKYVEKAGLRAAIPIQLAVAAVLHRLAYGLPPKIVAAAYGIGASTIVMYTQLVVDTLTDPDKLGGAFIALPPLEKQIEISNAFLQIFGVPNMVAEIDGTHIKLAQRPNNDDEPAAYWSRHDMHLVILQACCDHRKLFLDVSCSYPGGQHDVTVLRSSSLWKKLVNRIALTRLIISVGGEPVQPFLYGDQAYPIMPFLMKGYETESDREKKLFNSHMSRSRVKIECAFVTLKNKWKILKNLNVSLN